MSGDTQEVEGWNEYRRFVLAALGESRRANERIESRLSHIEDAVIRLQTKASVWGAVAGIVASSLVALLLKLL